MTSIREPLDRLVGTWTTEATHPALPGVVVHGTSTFEWLEGRRFLVQRSRTDHPDFPDSMSVLGDMSHDRVEDGARGVPDEPGGTLMMHYFDSRGVFRAFEASVDDGAWRFWNDGPGFPQRFTGTFADGGETIRGAVQLRQDATWEDDLQITFRRLRPARSRRPDIGTPKK